MKRKFDQVNWVSSEAVWADARQTERIKAFWVKALENLAATLQR